MTYRDEIVDEVRAIREQLCNQAGSLDNLLTKLRDEEAAHPERMAKHLNVYGKKQKITIPHCAEDRAQYSNG